MMGRHPSDIAPPQKAIWGPDAGLPAITADTTRKDDVRTSKGSQMLGTEPARAERNLAQRIARERRRKGWSAADLARRVSEAGVRIPPNAVTRVEQGQRKVGVNELVALARALGTTVDDLLTDMAVVDDRELAEHAKEVANDLQDLRAAGGCLVRNARRLWTDAFADDRDGSLVADVLRRVIDDQRRQPKASDEGDQLAAMLAAQYVEELLAVVLIGPASAPVKLTREAAALYLERLANAVAWLDNVEALHALQDETGGTSDG